VTMDPPRVDSARGVGSAFPTSALLPHPRPPGASEPGSSRKRVTELLDALRGRAQGRHVVVIRGYPDPDSLASAWAHTLLSASVGIPCDIVHMPLISRAENRAMVNLLEVPLLRISALEELERYAALCLVDANAIE